MKIFATVADGSLVIFKQNQGKNTKYKAPELILPACLKICFSRNEALVQEIIHLKKVNICQTAYQRANT